MADEINKNPNPEKGEDKVRKPEDNYLETIESLKKTRVPREDYDKLMEDNKKLLDAIINGNDIQKESSEEVETDTGSRIKTLRNELYGNEPKRLTNLEYIKKTLELRQHLIEEGNVDPFVPQGTKVNATTSDFQAAENVATKLQGLVDECGDDEIQFNSKLRLLLGETKTYRG